MAFKDCFPFLKCITHINDEHLDDAENLHIIIPMYNSIEYSDKYLNTSRGLWQFKRDESPVTIAENPGKVSTDNSTPFKCKSSCFTKILE